MAPIVECYKDAAQTLLHKLLSNNESAYPIQLGMQHTTIFIIQ